MGYAAIVLLILTIALDAGIPPMFALSLAIEENEALNPDAISPVNYDGSRDLGIMQLSDRYINEFVNDYWDKPWEFNWRDPYDNIYIGCKHIKEIMKKDIFTFWEVCVVYNAGYSRLENPPMSTLTYAERIMARWAETDSKGFTAVIPKK